MGERTLVTLRVRPGRTSMQRNLTSWAELNRPSCTDCRMMRGRSWKVRNHSESTAAMLASSYSSFTCN